MEESREKQENLVNHVPTKTFDELLIQHLGQFGRFQWFLFLSLSVVALAATWHNLIHVFTAAVPRHVCTASESFRIEESTLDRALLGTHEELLGHTESVTEQTESTIMSLAYTKPDMFTVLPPMGYDMPDWRNHTNTSYDNTCFLTMNNITQACTEWKYDTSVYKSSIITQWNLVCNRRWLASFAQALHMAGCMVGTLLFGMFSDRYGRRMTLLITTFAEIAIGISTAFVPLFELYVLFRFLIGMMVAGQYNSAYVIGIELVGPKWRGVAGVMMMFMSAVGIMAMSGLAYLVRDWHHLQLVVSAPLALLLSYCLVAPESPRWLLVHNKMKGAKDLIEKLAKYNGKKLPSDYVDWMNTEGQVPREGRRHSVLDIINSRKIRIRTVILFFLWFTVSLTYYGVSLYTSNLGGSDYLNCFLSGIVELPAYTFSIWCLSRFGRRIPVSISMVLSGLFLVLTSPFADDEQLLRIVLSMAGKMCISVAYVIMYPFSAEMFPTVVRSNGLGMVTVGTRVGGFVAPLILPLGDISTTIPLVICGGFAFLGGFLVLQLPETYNVQLPESIEDAENMKYKSVTGRIRRSYRKLGRRQHKSNAVPLSDKQKCPSEEIETEYAPDTKC